MKKLYKAECAFSNQGTRVEKNETLELDENFAKGLGVDVSEVIDSVEKKEEVQTESAPIGDFSLSELRAKADELGLSKGGSKADLIERISLAQTPDDGEYAN